ETVAIGGVETNSLASTLGLKTGDIINSVEIIKEGKTINITIDRTFKLIDAMLLVRRGDSIVFNYSRDGVAGSVTTPILTANNFIDIK
ncbi:MAG: hypothetical protein J6Q15_01145, partial [Clostridia bacterium]|nr:hypothetical protein [Clostridia bacterium]